GPPAPGCAPRVSANTRGRRDAAGVLAAAEEGVKGKRDVEWRRADAVVPGSKFDEAIEPPAKQFATQSARAASGPGITLTPLKRTFTAGGIKYPNLAVEFECEARIANITMHGPSAPPPASADAMFAFGAQFWPL